MCSEIMMRVTDRELTIINAICLNVFSKCLVYVNSISAQHIRIGMASHFSPTLLKKIRWTPSGISQSG